MGLNSVSHFRECFKEEYGLSPSEYLRKVKGNDNIQDNLSSKSDK
ncbi:MAG: AraC family transcriptional regulator [Bacteroides sp.]